MFPAGAPDQRSGTIVFTPSQVKRAGIFPPAGNAVLVSTNCRSREGRRRECACDDDRRGVSTVRFGHGASGAVSQPFWPPSPALRRVLPILPIEDTGRSFLPTRLPQSGRRAGERSAAVADRDPWAEAMSLHSAAVVWTMRAHPRKSAHPSCHRTRTARSRRRRCPRDDSDCEGSKTRIEPKVDGRRAEQLPRDSMDGSGDVT